MLKKVQQQKIEYKRLEDIAKMREAGKIVAAALRLAREMARPGVRTLDIDQAVEEFYRQQGVEPLFKGHPGRVPFPACCCITVNEQVVHGIPGPRVLREGDLLKVDTACKKDGWCADAAISIIVGEGSPAIRRLVQVAQETLELAIREMGRRQWWSEVAALMEKYVKGTRLLGRREIRWPRHRAYHARTASGSQLHQLGASPLGLAIRARYCGSRRTDGEYGA
jgi:methionyl aminopeptidase